MLSVVLSSSVLCVIWAALAYAVWFSGVGAQASAEFHCERDGDARGENTGPETEIVGVRPR
jgi:hypothetical protein